ncbi:cysteine peptidase family C39 domain-containing protein [Seonamhaeicola sp. NFXS20]
MAKITIKQHDITDCGAACLASIAAHYNLQMPIIRCKCR